MWILVAGVLAAMQDLSTGVIVALLFVIPNMIGLALWHSRKLSCYASTQLLAGISAICGLLTVHVLESASLWTQIQTGRSLSAASSYWLIALVFGGLMIMFHLQFGRRGMDPEA